MSASVELGAEQGVDPGGAHPDRRGVGQVAARVDDARRRCTAGAVSPQQLDEAGDGAVDAPRGRRPARSGPTPRSAGRAAATVRAIAIGLEPRHLEQHRRWWRRAISDERRP